MLWSRGVRTQKVMLAYVRVSGTCSDGRPEGSLLVTDRGTCRGHGPPSTSAGRPRLPLYVAGSGTSVL